MLKVFFISSGGESYLGGLLLKDLLNMRLRLDERMRRGNPSSPLILSRKTVMSLDRVNASTAGFTFSGVVNIIATVSKS